MTIHKTIGAAFIGRHNNFDAIRLAAASCVIISHAYLITSGQLDLEPLVASTGLSLGAHAVNIFFIVSGFLVFASLDRQSSIANFAAARLLRVLPGLVAAALFVALILGPLVTHAALADYFHGDGVGRFLASILIAFDTDTTLPGLFDTLPRAGDAMATVWTLKYELLMYAGMTLFGALRLARSTVALWLTAAALAIAALVYASMPAIAHALPALLHVIRLGACFLFGMIAYKYRDRLPLTWLPVAVLAAAAWLMRETYLYWPLLFAAESYLTFVLAFAQIPAIGVIVLPADISYGLYLYGWPLEQTLKQAFPTIQPELLAISCFATTVLLALASWRYIEMPAMKLRRLLTRQPAPPAAAVGGEMAA